MEGNNFNLDNTFVRLLRYRCDLLDSLSVKLITAVLVRAITFIVAEIVLVLVMINDKTSPIRLLICMDLYLAYINGSTFGRAYFLLQSPEKAKLNDIIYNDYYKTHKVNTEILMDDIMSADKAIGAVTESLNREKGLIVVQLILAFAIICVNLFVR